VLVAAGFATGHGGGSQRGQVGQALLQLRGLLLFGGQQPQADWQQAASPLQKSGQHAPEFLQVDRQVWSARSQVALAVVRYAPGARAPAARLACVADTEQSTQVCRHVNWQLLQVETTLDAFESGAQVPNWVRAAARSAATACCVPWACAACAPSESGFSGWPSLNVMLRASVPSGLVVVARPSTTP